jgi:hypothetical protein
VDPGFVGPEADTVSWDPLLEKEYKIRYTSEYFLRMRNHNKLHL